MRGLACVVMFQTHCYDSWLGGAAREGNFIRWSQLGGTLPAPLFLFLAGISSALLTDRMRQKGTPPGTIARTTILRGAEIFGLALLWAWLNIPIPIYGTLWLLALAYFTVLLPLGVRTLAGVVLQIDKSLEECARVCGASWFYQLRTVTMPLLRPGIVAAWLLVFIASVRELGVSIFLVGPNAKVIAPSIVSAWLSSSSELSAALALIQTVAIFIAVIVLFRATRRYSREQA